MRNASRLSCAFFLLFSLLLVGVSPTQAAEAVSGPSAAHFYEQYTVSPKGRSVTFTLREGNSSFGYAHIAKGGSTGNTGNHELTPYAKDRWREAFVEGPKRPTSWPGGYVYTRQYATPGGRPRTMCIIVDGNDYVYAGQNYGTKGVITAFWIAGHLDS